MRNYQYKGGDNGITYKYFYNPMASFLIDYIPENIAPNLITFVGFVFSVLPAFLLFSLFGTNFYGEISSWWFFF